MEPQPPLSPVALEYLTSTICYALTHGMDGKPLGTKLRADPGLLARNVAAHLERCRMKVMQLPPIKPHTAGG